MTDQQESESSTLAVVEESDVIKRIRLITDHFTKSIAKDPSKKKVAFLLRRITEEAIEEMVDAPEEILEYYMTEATAILYWAATGMVIENMPLPDDFQPDLELSAKAVQKALEAY